MMVMILMKMERSNRRIFQKSIATRVKTHWL